MIYNFSTLAQTSQIPGTTDFYYQLKWTRRGVREGRGRGRGGGGRGGGRGGDWGSCREELDEKVKWHFE